MDLLDFLCTIGSSVGKCFTIYIEHKEICSFTDFEYEKYDNIIDLLIKYDLYKYKDYYYEGLYLDRDNLMLSFVKEL